MKTKILLLLLTIPAIIALLKPGYFPMHDDIQGMRLLEMHKCFLDFQIPCRWVPDMGAGFGYPQFNFYSPLPYYLMEIPVLFGGSILASVKLGFLASLVLSAWSMYLLGSFLWGKKGGVISALFYTYAPYRAVDIYVRGAMGEAWAFVFLPLILLFTLKPKSTIPLALSIAGLFLTHNITVIMFSPFYVTFVLFFRKNHGNDLKNILKSGILGFALSAFFTLPAFLEKNYTHVESVLMGYFNYLAHFVGVGQLFLSTHWGYGVSSLGELDGMSLSVGVLHWSIPLLVLILLFYLKKIEEFRKVLIFVILGFLALFLIHPRSQFIWDNVSLLSYIQFPWRFLGIAVFCFSLASGALIKLTNRKLLMVITIFVILILMNGSFFKPERYVYITDGEKFSGDSWLKQQTISILDYLPAGAQHPPTSPASNGPKFSGEVISGQKGTNWQTWELNVYDEDNKLELPLFYFPGWEVKVDGEPVKIDSANELGLITVDVPSGQHLVEARLKDTNLRLIANLVSLIGLGALVLYRKIKWLSH